MLIVVVCDHGPPFFHPQKKSFQDARSQSQEYDRVNYTSYFVENALELTS